MDSKLTGYKPSSKNRLLNDQIVDEISPFLPERMQLRPQWTLKYSLEQDGASIKTFYKSAERPVSDHQQHGYVLVVRDARNGLFGAYANEVLKPSEGRYRGNNDCFLWKHEGDKVKAFPYRGTNDFAIFCTHHFVSFGGGDGHYGLWIDDSLDKGVSYPSLTYENETLSAQGSKFDIIGLELWVI